jgi:hypothetical protein
MKKIAVLFMILALAFIGCDAGGGGGGGGSDPSITVLTPSVSTPWYCVDLNEVTWSSEGVTGNVKIEVFQGDTLSLEIVADTENDGTFEHAPVVTLPTGSYTMVVTSLADSAVTGSLAFSLLSAVECVRDYGEATLSLDAAVLGDEGYFLVQNDSDWTIDISGWQLSYQDVDDNPFVVSVTAYSSPTSTAGLVAPGDICELTVASGSYRTDASFYLLADNDYSPVSFCTP